MAAAQELAERVKPEGSETCYIDTDVGVDDDTADGSEAKPYKSLAYAYIQQHNNQSATSKYLARASQTGAVAEGEDAATARSQWKDPPKSALKKAQGALDAHKKKLQKQAQANAEEEKARKQRAQNLEEAKKVVLKEDPSLPPAMEMVTSRLDIELGDGDQKKGARVKIYGRIHRLRIQKHATFITLDDGFGQLQCILQAGDLTKTYDALTFAITTSLCLYGELREVPKGQTAPDNRELHIDYYEVIGPAPSDDDAISTRVSSSQNSWEPHMLDLRHLVLRGDIARAVMKVRAAVKFAFVMVYNEMNFTEVSPPAFVQTQVEGGGDLFKIPYFKETAYLTQSSQLYLETCLPLLNSVYCIEKSFRAEESDTRRHLAEFTHIEAEIDYIKFDNLLEHLEEIICRVIDMVLADPKLAPGLKLLNPNFQKPSRPFKRMKYTEAIDWLNAQDPPILNSEGNPHVFGDDIAEAAERKMTDTINRPIFLTHFPAEIKAFYMKKDPADRRVTESVDCLMPGVGEIVGGSMRMDDYDELMQAFKDNNIGSKDYYWYTDQRKYGTSPHGGYGLGLERFVAWLADQHTVRNTCLYPRFRGRCRP